MPIATLPLGDTLSLSRRWRNKLACLVLVGFSASTSARAQETSAVEADPSRLTLDRIFVEKEFGSKGFDAHWLEQGEGYTYVDEVDGEDGRAIWHSKPDEETPRILVSPRDLTPSGTNEPLSIDGYAFSESMALVLIYTNTERVWRRNTRGDYWILDRATGVLRQLGGPSAPESSLMFAKISPTERHVAYVRSGNLYAEDLIDHSVRPLTRSKDPRIIHGTSDWVYEEELGLRDGFRWSPDGQRIAFWQFDETEVHQQTMIDNVSGLYPKLIQFGYPKVGQDNAACRVGVVELRSEDIHWMDVPGNSKNHYIARMEWREKQGDLIIRQLNRAQNTLKVFVANPHDGSTTPILTEVDDAWIDIHDEMFWVDKGRKFTWLSERGGWRQLYLVSAFSQEQRLLTPGEFDVIRLLKVDEIEQWAYFIASPDNPAERYLYRVGLDGENLSRLTPAGKTRGTHGYQISPDGRYAAVTTSTYDAPPVTELVSLPDHQTLRVLESNEELHQKIAALDRPTTEFFYIDIDADVSLHGRCMKPPQFDSSKRYPLLIHVYGEPAGQVVTDRWSGNTHLWHMMLAQKGYVIMSFDNRGTAAPRGRAWRKAAHHKIGVLAPKDQAAAVRTVLRERAYLDPNRVGSWGWSGGGSMSLNAIFKYPELYQTAMAIASVPNQRHYDTIYQERYMGLPTENPEGYREGSPIHFAHQLQGDLLIVHGAADDNCHYQTFEKLVDRLVSENKDFTMMTYPRGTHSIKEGRNTTRHLYGLMTRFLLEKLPLDH